MTKVLHLSESSQFSPGGIVSVVNDLVDSFEQNEEFEHSAYFDGDQSPSFSLTRRLTNKISRSITIEGMPFRITTTRVRTPKINMKNVDILHVHKPTFFDFCCVQKLQYPKVEIIIHAHSIDGFSGGCVLENECKELERGCQSCPIVRRGFRGAARTGMKMRSRQFSIMKPTIIANSRYTYECVSRSPLKEFFRSIHVVTPSVAVRQPNAQQLKSFACSAVLGFAAASAGESNKQFRHFVDLIKELNANGNQVHGRVAGTPPPGIWPPEITFLGSLAPNELPTFYRSLNALVICSQSESFGKVSIESQIFGTPVIAYRVGGIPETILSGLTGILVRPNDRSELRAAALKVLENNHIFKERLKSDEAQSFLSRFAVKTIESQYAAIYRQLNVH